MKKEVLDYNSKMMDICLKELEEYVKTKENNKNEKIVENKKAIKGIRKYRLGYDFLFLPNIIGVASGKCGFTTLRAFSPLIPRVYRLFIYLMAYVIL